VTIPRTKGSKNKKTIAKEKLQEVSVSDKPIIIEEPKQKLALRLFTLEKVVHDNFIKHISQFKDPKLYESYIVNELMVKYVNGKIKLPLIDTPRMHDFMMAYGHVGFDPSESKELYEVDEFKIANRLLSRKGVNSFIQYQYPIIVDPDIKTCMSSKGLSTSYIMNELLKLYVIEHIKVDVRDFKIKEWELMYKSALKKLKIKEDEI